MKIIAILVKGFCNLTEKQKATLKTLKFKKNTMRILEDTCINRSILSSTSLVHWALAEESDIAKLFTKQTYHLNNPKKGHIYKNYGLKTYALFKKQFIDRMYLRL